MNNNALNKALTCVFDDAYRQCRGIFKEKTGRDFIEGNDMIEAVNFNGSFITFRIIEGDKLTLVAVVKYELNFGA